MSDEYFKKVDDKLAQEKDAKDKAKIAELRNISFIEGLIPHLLPIAKSYEEELKKRGLTVKVSSTSRSLSFEMKYADGGHYSLSLAPDIKSQRLSFKTFFTNDDGRNLSSETGNQYNEDNWNDEIFESNIKKVIESFLAYADRHGGTGAKV